MPNFITAHKLFGFYIIPHCCWTFQRESGKKMTQAIADDFRQGDLCREKRGVKINKTRVSPEQHGGKYSNITVTTQWRDKPLKDLCCGRETAWSDSPWSSQEQRQQERLVNRPQWCCLPFFLSVEEDEIYCCGCLGLFFSFLFVVTHLVPICVCVCVFFFYSVVVNHIDRGKGYPLLALHRLCWLSSVWEGV